jgi:hypothetical protein
MKKVFEGMTPNQIWDYIKKLPKEERDKLLFELDDEDMRKMTKKNPQFLKGIEFNIPVFNAEKQMYLCTNVDEVSTSREGKAYKISLSEVKQSYAVPERIVIDLFIPHTDANGEPASVNMSEVRPTSRNLPLTKVMVTKSKLTSLSGLKKVFYNMAKSI